MSSDKNFDFDAAIKAALDQKFDLGPRKAELLKVEPRKIEPPKSELPAPAREKPKPEPAIASRIEPRLGPAVTPPSVAPVREAVAAPVIPPPRREETPPPSAREEISVPPPSPPAAIPVAASASMPSPAPKPTPDIAAPAGRRHVWLCADDYGISPAVNEGIRELILRGRLNATSVMVVAPSFGRSEALPLSIMRTGSQKAAIGLHLTLTAPFAPLSSGYGPTQRGGFLPLRATLIAAMLGRLRPEKIAVEVGAQIKAFTAAFGVPPDFIDGHQHVQVFPQIREAVVGAVKYSAPDAWLRQCGGSGSLLTDRKGWLINRFSRRLRLRAAKAGLKTNPAFAGTYNFRRKADYNTLFRRFLRNMAADGVVMCHPGHVDEELRRLDPLTDMREKEYAYLAGEEFGALLNELKVSLD
jgi:predicted glycoside hydrolase/deacetylase ChbG (UPF0249 family)